MTVLITLTTAGSDSGPFNLYSDADGFTSAFETGVTKVDLLAGYSSALVPDPTTIIRVMSNNALCTNYIDLELYPTTTTTTTLANYGIKRCGDLAPFIVAAIYPFSTYDVIQFQIGAPGSGTVYCGEVGGIVGGVPDATIYSPTVYSCGDVVSCP